MNGEGGFDKTTPAGHVTPRTHYCPGMPTRRECLSQVGLHPCMPTYWTQSRCRRANIPVLTNGGGALYLPPEHLLRGRDHCCAARTALVSLSRVVVDLGGDRRASRRPARQPSHRLAGPGVRLTGERGRGREFEFRFALGSVLARRTPH